MKNDKLTYRLKQSKRKTISVYVSRDGTIDVLAPESMDRDRIDEMVQSKAYSIYKSKSEFNLLNESMRNRELVSGETFLYLGRNYRLEYDEKYPDLTLLNGRFHISRRSDEKVINAFKLFYKERGKIKIPERVSMYADRMGFTVRHIRIMELRNRWASCSNKNDLNFHWKCMMSPIKILDYIIVHELAHLQHRGHTDQFWALVDRVLPNYRDRKNWLRLNGAGMDL